jgi:hypothetical protein
VQKDGDQAGLGDVDDALQGKGMAKHRRAALLLGEEAERVATVVDALDEPGARERKAIETIVRSPSAGRDRRGGHHGASQDQALGVAADRTRSATSSRWLTRSRPGR